MVARVRFVVDDNSLLVSVMPSQRAARTFLPCDPTNTATHQFSSCRSSLTMTSILNSLLHIFRQIFYREPVQDLELNAIKRIPNGWSNEAVSRLIEQLFPGSQVELDVPNEPIPPPIITTTGEWHFEPVALVPLSIAGGVTRVVRWGWWFYSYETV